MNGLRLLKGALAGCIATVPTPVAMLLAHRLLPGEQQYALPPMLITRRLTGGKGPFARLGTHEHKGLTVLTHFGFGTSFGAVYALLPRQGPVPPVLRGILFALCIWTGSYLGWIPAAEILPSATKHPVERNALMIIAHIIWGSVLGWLLARLDPEETSRQERAVKGLDSRPAVTSIHLPAKPAAIEAAPAIALTTPPAPELTAADTLGTALTPAGEEPDLAGEQQAVGGKSS